MAEETPEQLAAEAARKEARKAEKAERKAALKERQKIKKDEAKKSLDDFMTDVKALAGEKKDDAANAIIHFSVNAMDKAEDASIEAQRIRLKPVFYDQIKISPAPDMIYICEQDKAHKSSSVCKGSIGHMARAAKMDVLYLYPESVDIYGVTFIPTEEEDVYYRHPFGENKYISLDEYFLRVKEEKINELNRIAQDLGATYVQITLMSERKTFTKAKGKAGIKGPVSIGANGSIEGMDLQKIDISTETTFGGNKPKKPKVLYFANDDKIQTLIQMRLKKGNVLKDQKYYIKYNSAATINGDLAVNIDLALKKMKVKGNASISNQAEEENRWYFEYIIKFPD